MVHMSAPGLHREARFTGAAGGYAQAGCTYAQAGSHVILYFNLQFFSLPKEKTRGSVQAGTQVIQPN